MEQSESYGDFAYIYDALTDNVEYEKRCDYICKLMQKHMSYPAELVADLGCGTGTICNLLCDRGYDCIGIDNSELMLGVATEKSVGKNILYLQQDMCAFELYGTVDVFLSMLDSINYITEPEKLEKMFYLVKNYLNLGGVFIFDVNTPYKFEQVLGDNTFTYDKDSIFYVWENSFDGEFCDMYLNFFVKKGTAYSRITEEHTQRCHTFRELSAIIRKCGLVLEAVYGDLSMEDPKSIDERIFFVVKKEK